MDPFKLGIYFQDKMELKFIAFKTNHEIVNIKFESDFLTDGGELVKMKNGQCKY